MSARNYPTEIGRAPGQEHEVDLKQPHFEARELLEQAAPLSSEERSRDNLPSIPILPIKKGRLMPIFLIAMSWAATIVLLVFIFRPIYFSLTSNLVTARFATMLLCVSLPATFLGYLASNQMRKLYIQRFVHLHQRGQLKSRDRQQSSVAVGVAGFVGELRSWKYGISYATAAIITPAMVSCLTPTIVPVSFVPSARIYPNHDRDSCFTTGRNRSELSAWSWQLEGATYMGVNRTASIECESEKIPLIVSAISTRYISYAYPIGGLLIDRAAVGAPVDPLGIPAGEFGTIDRHPDFQWATECFPSLTKNPVRCRAAPNAEFNVSANSLSVNINGCNGTNDVLGVDPTREGATVFGMCPDEKKFGALSIVIGSVNSAAELWATGMQDRSFNITKTSHDSLNRSRISYAAICSIDIAPSISYRQMTLTKKAGGYISGAVDNFIYNVIGDPSVSCVPKDQAGADIRLSTFVTKRALIVGAVSARQLLLQNYWIDGSMMKLHTFVSMFNPDTGRSNRQVYAFAESENALEDALGTLSGMGLGMYWGAQTRNRSEVAVEITNGNGGSSGWRMGSGEPYNVVYVIPSFASAIILSYLLYKGIRDGYA